MLSIGIDVSKGKSTVCGMKPGGEIVYTPFEVQHTREGMSELVSLLHNSGEEVRAVLESTGSYHCPVVAALLENGIFVSVINSLRMKRFCSQSIRKVKTDRIDAMQIALYGLAYWQELQPTKLPTASGLSSHTPASMLRRTSPANSARITGISPSGEIAICVRPGTKSCRAMRCTNRQTTRSLHSLRKNAARGRVVNSLWWLA